MNRCRYSLAWRGPCGRPVTKGDLCAEHAEIACGSCGGRATSECSHTGQFVCGAPLCDDCEGFTDASKPSGSWGFLNHGHRSRIACDTPTAAGLADGGGR